MHANEPERQPEHRSIVERWEALAGPAQFALSFVPVLALLLLVHLTLFTRITTTRSIFYALGEAAIVAGMITLASQNEARSRQIRADEDQQHDDSQPPRPSGE